MKNSNFSLGSMPSVNELNDMLQDMMESTGGFINDMMKMQDSHKLMPGIISLSPDTYGCEQFFIAFFINDEMGEDGTYFYDEFPPMFHPEDMKVKVSKPGNAKTEKQIKKQAEPAGTEGSIYDENALLEEIDKLRCKVRKLESDNSNLRADLSEKRRIEEESKDISNQLEASNRELAVLRNYVYNLTENDNPVTDKSIKSMKETIANYRIVIIGGHLKWASKMKKEFPDWVFVSPDAGGLTDVSIVDKADYVYFFTDTISHSKYYQFMNVIRERGINFGYIHGVNVEKNIRDIYRDIVSLVWGTIG